jgi:hypothetical protein
MEPERSSTSETAVEGRSSERSRSGAQTVIVRYRTTFVREGIRARSVWIYMDR